MPAVLWAFLCHTPRDAAWSKVTQGLAQVADGSVRRMTRGSSMIQFDQLIIAAVACMTAVRLFG